MRDEVWLVGMMTSLPDLLTLDAKYLLRAMNGFQDDFGLSTY